MIAVDTSALMAILLGEERGAACAAALRTDEDSIVSGGTVAEALVVAARRNLRAQMLRLIEDFGMEGVPVTFGVAQWVAEAYVLWGKGAHASAQSRRLLCVCDREGECVPVAVCRRRFRQNGY